MALLRVIGTMSGTSMDGIDVALLETDGERVVRPGPTGFVPYAVEDRALLREALRASVALTARHERPDAVAQAERVVTRRHADAIGAFLAEHGLSTQTIDLVGFHGQTVLHRPADRLTVQIGDAKELAHAIGIRVAHDFRADDVAAGGQGAPIVPVYHRALAASSGIAGPVALLNVGGVGNITYLEEDRDPIAFDTGPGNALIDDLMFARTGEAMDRDGHTAARGRVNASALEQLMAHPYFRLPPPKSLDRDAFSAAPVAALSTEDAAATLTAFTAQSIADALSLLPATPRSLIVCGGGARNPILLRELVNRTACRVTTADACGWSADAIEAQAFGYLAARTILDLPLTFPTTTGVAAPMRGGRIVAP